MILSGSEIQRRVDKGDIVITPFDSGRIGANSYDLTLHDTLHTYSINKIHRDIKDINFLIPHVIPKTGFLLSPGKLYLGKTNEYTETRNLVPMIEGVSSVARHGMFIHVTAGFGDIGFCGNWTLEITVVESLVIYPNMRIAQIYYHTVEGEIQKTYDGKYQDSRDVIGSRIYKEFT